METCDLFVNNMFSFSSVIVGSLKGYQDLLGSDRFWFVVNGFCRMACFNGCHHKPFPAHSRQIQVFKCCGESHRFTKTVHPILFLYGHPCKMKTSQHSESDLLSVIEGMCLFQDCQSVIWNVPRPGRSFQSPVRSSGCWPQ